MPAGTAPTLESVTDELLSLVDADVRTDLVREDPALAIEVHFDDVRVRALPDRAFAGDDCSTDGFYDPSTDPRGPWIFYADDVVPQRARFTLLHELCHHLISTRAFGVLDDLDRIAGSSQRAMQLEESVCHRFAGALLIPGEVVQRVVGSGSVRPSHVRDVHELVASAASWDAVAVRVSEYLTSPGAIVIMRDSHVVGFCAARGVENIWWPRGSAVDPQGPLARAIRFGQSAQPERYRWNLSFARTLHCDTLPIHDHLAVAVLSDKPSDGSLNILEEVEPIWKTREYWCEVCNEERTKDWCDRCRGPYCAECGRCGCSAPAERPACPRCFLKNRVDPGQDFCVDCVEDLYG